MTSPVIRCTPTWATETQDTAKNALGSVSVPRTLRGYTSTGSIRMTLLTVRAAAERLGVGYSTLKRWVLTGRVRTTQTAGGHHRISEAEIDRLLARRSPDDRPVKRLPVDDQTIADISARNRLHGYIEEVGSMACWRKCGCVSAIRPSPPSSPLMRSAR